MNELTLQKCLEYAELGWLNKHVSEDGRIIGFKYSLQTVYDHAWDEITLQCRGIAFDAATGTKVAHPFNKFFNFEEIWTEDGQLAEVGKVLASLGHGYEPNLTKKFRAMDKIDGSLIIVYHYDNDWKCKTGGSFNSDQAVWAKKWFDKNVNTESMIPGYTYCFEVVYDGDPHVCHYDFKGLVLLGYFDWYHNEASMIDIVEMSYKMGVRYSQEMQFDSVDDMIKYARGLDVDHEGFVVTFSSGFKVKVKGVEYLDKFHQIYGITKKDIRAHFNTFNLSVESEYKKAIPEECPLMKNYAEELERRTQQLQHDVYVLADKIKHLSGRERYEAAMADGNKLIGSLAVAVATGKNVNEKIFYHVVDDLKKRDPEESDL